MISVLDIFKIGIGPSSSHTVGPMKAAKEFVDELAFGGTLPEITHLIVDVYGSLSWTGKGHHTDRAILLGLAGHLPDTVEIDLIEPFLKQIEEQQVLPLGSMQHPVEFPPSAMVFHDESLVLHENGMTLTAYANDKILLKKTYYSIGGGTIVDEEHFEQRSKKNNAGLIPYPFSSAEELVHLCHEHGISIASLMLANEKVLHGESELQTALNGIWMVMHQGVERGCHKEGILPGPLKVSRRAAPLYRLLTGAGTLNNDPMMIVDWVNMFALAVSEENAAGGRVVTAPTNGAAGIIPAVMSYYNKFVQPLGDIQIRRFYLTAAAIGILYQMNASISGAEVGCQGEVGVACSMAAAGLAEIMGGSAEQICVAAEIAMEHHLGLTCDPIAGQVQVPCIERNAIGAMKAINASRMALRRTTKPSVSLDKVIETMYATGKDMDPKYRETSKGGLAIKVVCQ